MAASTALSARAIRRVVLVEPRSPDLHIFSRFRLPRLGAVLLGTILRDRGLDVSVVVEEVTPIDMSALRRADLVGISSITSTARRSYEIADALRIWGVPVVMGGPHPTHCAEEALEHCDYVVRGEGEEALPSLVASLRSGLDLAEVPNLSYRKDGEVHHNPAASLVRDLDRYPDPDFSLIEGFSGSGSLGTRRVVPIQTSRGCPYDCSFCSVTPTFGRKMRYRSVDRVVAEMWRHDLRRTHFFIYDDNFTANRRRAREMLAGFKTLPLKPSWSAQVRADVAKDVELLELMRETGCTTVYIGLESVNQESLANADKRQEVDEVSTHLHRIRAAGIDVHGMFVLGFDEDTAGTMERTLAFAREHDLWSIQLLLLTPLPGSRWAVEMEAAGRILHRDWGLYDAHHVCFRPSRISPAELQRWQADGHARFYSLGRLIRCLAKGDLPRAIVTLYAAKLNYDWKRRNAAYLASLGPSLAPPAPARRSLAETGLLALPVEPAPVK